MKVDVLLCVFNGENTLERSLQSIIDQTHKIDRLIIINDASTDSSLKIINLYIGILPIDLINNKTNLGLTSSLILGMKHSQAEWVFRIDSDDYWMPNHVEKLLGIIKPNVAALSSQAIYIDECGERVGVSKLVTNANIRKLMMWDNPVVHSSVAINRKAYFQVGGYRNIEWEDYDLWVRLLESGEIFICETPTVFYTKRANSLSRIDYKQAIISRWHLQKNAITIFFKRYPFYATGVYIISLIRVFWTVVLKR